MSEQVRIWFFIRGHLLFPTGLEVVVQRLVHSLTVRQTNHGVEILATDLLSDTKRKGEGGVRSPTDVSIQKMKQEFGIHRERDMWRFDQRVWWLTPVTRCCQLAADSSSVAVCSRHRIRENHIFGFIPASYSVGHVLSSPYENFKAWDEKNY